MFPAERNVYVFKQQDSWQGSPVLPLCPFDDIKIFGDQEPVLRKRKSELPIADAAQIQFFNEVEFRLDGAGVFKPHFMAAPFAVGVKIKRRLRIVVVLDGHIIPCGAPDRFLRAQGFRDGTFLGTAASSHSRTSFAPS